MSENEARKLLPSLSNEGTFELCYVTFQSLLPPITRPVDCGAPGNCLSMTWAQFWAESDPDDRLLRLPRDPRWPRSSAAGDGFARSTSSADAAGVRSSQERAGRARGLLATPCGSAGLTMSGNTRGPGFWGSSVQPSVRASSSRLHFSGCLVLSRAPTSAGPSGAGTRHRPPRAPGTRAQEVSAKLPLRNGQCPQRSCRHLSTPSSPAPEPRHRGP